MHASLWDGPPGDSQVPSPGQLLLGPPCLAPAWLGVCGFSGPMWATGQGGVCFSQTFLRSDDVGEDDEDEDEEEEEEEEEEEGEEEEEDEEEEEEEEPQQEEQGEESSTPSRKGQGPNSGVSPAGQSPAPGPGVLRPLPREGGWGCLGPRTADSFCLCASTWKRGNHPSAAAFVLLNPRTDVSAHL